LAPDAPAAADALPERPYALAKPQTAAAEPVAQVPAAPPPAIERVKRKPCIKCNERERTKFTKLCEACTELPAAAVEEADPDAEACKICGATGKIMTYSQYRGVCRRCGEREARRDGLSQRERVEGND
jgi:hypothetical protein